MELKIQGSPAKPVDTKFELVNNPEEYIFISNTDSFNIFNIKIVTTIEKLSINLHKSDLINIRDFINMLVKD